MRHLITGKAKSLAGLLSVLCFSCPALSVIAAPSSAPVDAGSIMRDQQQPKLPQLQQLPVPEKSREEAVKTDAGVLVAVKDFTFTGHEGVATESELQALVAGVKGKSISFAELKAVVGKVTTHLKGKGWFLAKAYLPKQDVTSGIISVVVVQGASDGRVEFKMDKAARVSKRVLSKIGKTVVEKGQPLNDKELERSVLLMNDLPGVTARASLSPGADPGTTGVVYSVTEGPVYSGVILGDNHGNTYTGEWRLNANIAVNDPFRSGDQISTFLTRAEGLLQGRIAYSAPVFVTGLRGILSYTGMSYELGEELKTLDYKGSSNALDVGFSYPLVRTRTKNVTASLTGGYKSLVDKKGDVELSDKTIYNVTMALDCTRYDQFWGGGATNFSFGVTTGDFNDSLNDLESTGKEGQFSRFNLALGRLQRVSETVNMNISATAQKSLNNLDSSQKLSLGGPNGVRAYPVGEAPGDEGQLVNVDMRYNVPFKKLCGTLQLVGFYDAGHITLNRTRYTGDVTNDANRNTYWIQGAGVGFNYVVSGTGALRCVWAHTLGSNLGKELGQNSDGSNDKQRFWLQGELYF